MSWLGNFNDYINKTIQCGWLSRENFGTKITRDFKIKKQISTLSNKHKPLENANEKNGKMKLTQSLNRELT